jgi:hypothetical protein
MEEIAKNRINCNVVCVKGDSSDRTGKLAHSFTRNTHLQRTRSVQGELLCKHNIRFR